MNEKMKFVVWGAGFRGRKLLSILKEEKILAFIDSDETKIGKKIGNLPIINFQNYCEKYRNYFIIISNDDYQQIESFLIKQSIYQYFILSECPSEFKGYGISELERLLDFSAKELTNNIIVGSNLFSCLLYEKIKFDGCKKLYCYPNEMRLCGTIDKLIELLHINVLTDLEIIKNQKGVAYFTTRENKKTDIIIRNKFDCINAYDFSYRFKEYYNPALEKFKNIHIEKRCFIVATGPSLEKSDLEVLYRNKEICFGVNRIFNLTNCNWIPDYYVAVDTKFLNDYYQEIINYPVKAKFLHGARVDNDYKDEVYSLHCVTDDIFDELPLFSEDIAHVGYGGATVTYVCIQIAAYMGFKEIYLLGVDCNYLINSRNNYFFTDQKEDNIKHKTDRMLLSYQAAKEYMLSHDIEILNATRGGKLEVFERVDFDSLFYGKE